MTQHLPESYVFNAADPRAPSHEQWSAMAPVERARVVAMLPARVPHERIRQELEQRAAALAAELTEEKQRREEAEHSREDEQHRREEAERRLAEALAEIDRLERRRG